MSCAPCRHRPASMPGLSPLVTPLRNSHSTLGGRASDNGERVPPFTNRSSFRDRGADSPQQSRLIRGGQRRDGRPNSLTISAGAEQLPPSRTLRLSRMVDTTLAKKGRPVERLAQTPLSPTRRFISRRTRQQAAFGDSTVDNARRSSHCPDILVTAMCFGSSSGRLIAESGPLQQPDNFLPSV